MEDCELTGMEQYEEVRDILAEILKCGTADVAAIGKMIRTHDDLIEVTSDYIEDTGVSWSFAAFVAGVERVVLEEISDRIIDELYDGIATVTLDNNYVAWGLVSDSGDLDSTTADVFAEMCVNGVTDERVERLITTYEASAGVGGYDNTQ